MKKLICLLCIIIIFAGVALSGCSGNKEVESVTINDETYYSLYIYSFDNAQISNISKTLYASDELITKLSKTGYTILKNKDMKDIKVYKEYIFSQEANMSVTENDFGCEAEIVEMIKDYPIEIEMNKDTYTITYYTYSGVSTVSKVSKLTDGIEKHIVEVAKENVVIKYRD